MTSLWIEIIRYSGFGYHLPANDSNAFQVASVETSSSPTWTFKLDLSLQVHFIMAESPVFTSGCVNRQSKISCFDFMQVPKHYVLQFDITMNDIFCMTTKQCFCLFDNVTPSFPLKLYNEPLWQYSSIR